MEIKIHGERPTGIELTENAIAVLKKRYLKKNEQGEAIEGPIDMFVRVASNIAEGELKFKQGEAQVDFSHL